MRGTRTIAASVCVVAWLAGWGAPSRAQAPEPVTLGEDDSAYTLANGVVTARIAKDTGDIISLVYQGIETLARPASGHPYGYWSHSARAPRQQHRVTIDPLRNDGERAEVSIKGFYDGAPLGQGPGGGFPADIEIRYALARGDSGIYTYSIFEHRSGYPAGTLGEARFAAKLTDTFDWMLVDSRHNFHISRMQVPDYNKYNYTTIQFDNPVYGFASTQEQIGLFFMHASHEYMTGPPTKVEFLGHAHNTLLAYWRSSHYGGGSVDVAAGEHWTKVIGPMLLYVNSGGDPQALWRNAQQRQRREAASWPYSWVAGVDYPHAAGRGTVTGRLRVSDGGEAVARLQNLRVGLAHPAYAVTTGRPAAQNAPAEVDWDTDAKHYAFWVVGEADGRFTIPHVRPGRYTLHAFADGVLGHLRLDGVQVTAGGTVDLGDVRWQLVRHGRTLWEIGEINRSGVEFAFGAQHAQSGMDRVYAEHFPAGVHYVVGSSDYRKDWFYRHAPHPDGPQLTPWKVSFELDAKPPAGRTTLRLALAGKQSPAVRVTVNGVPAGEAAHLWFDSALGRNQIRGLWALRDVGFDAALLREGRNTIELSFDGGGVIYDYLRLELAER